MDLPGLIRGWIELYGIYPNQIKICTSIQCFYVYLREGNYYIHSSKSMNKDQFLSWVNMQNVYEVSVGKNVLYAKLI